MKWQLHLFEAIWNKQCSNFEHHAHMELQDWKLENVWNWPKLTSLFSFSGVWGVGGGSQKERELPSENNIIEPNTNSINFQEFRTVPRSEEKRHSLSETRSRETHPNMGLSKHSRNIHKTYNPTCGIYHWKWGRVKLPDPACL